MTPGNSKIYIIRAMHQYITDHAGIPHLGIDIATGITYNGLLGLDDAAEEGLLFLSISTDAVYDLDMGDKYISFSGTMRGIVTDFQIPVESIFSIHDRDSQEGVQFEAGKPVKPKADNHLQSEFDAQEARKKMKAIPGNANPKTNSNVTQLKPKLTVVK